MLAALKDFLRSILSPLTVPLFYVGLGATSFVAIFRRAEWGLYALVVLLPLPNIRYQFKSYPLGKDLIDIFLFSILLGIFINKGGFKRTPNGILLVIFALVNYIAVWHTSINFGLPLPLSTANPLVSEWKNYAELFLLYFLVFNCIQDEKQQKIVTTLIAGVMLFIAVREFRNFSASAAFSYDKRVEGPFWVMGLGANHMGAFIAHYGAVILGMLLLDDNRRRRWLYIAALVFSLHPLFFCYSRGAYVGALMAVAFFGVVQKRALLVGLIVLGVAWQTLLPPTVVERITMTESSEGQLEESAAKRVQLWDHAVALFEANPIFGIGYGGFSYSVSVDGLTDTHNFYMRVLSEQGLIGIILFAIVLLAAFRSGWRLYRIGRSPYMRGLGLGFMGCIVAESLTNLFGDRWSYFVLGGYLFIFWGVVDRGIRLSEEPVAEPVASDTESPPSADEPASAAQQPAA